MTGAQHKSFGDTRNMLMKFLARSLTCFCFGLLSSPALASVDVDTLIERLSRAAPNLNHEVLSLAVNALDCADHQSLRDARLAVIDYSLPSTEPRLWVFDLARQELLFEELVAHGRASGDKFSTRFSNVPGSHQSSIGLFRTLRPYTGRNGYSLRMEGLEPRFNSKAHDRAIVIHGASYVSPEFIDRTGRIGRSHGCPAVSTDTARPLIETLQDGHYVFSYYPDPNYLAASRLLNCPQQVALRQ